MKYRCERRIFCFIKRGQVLLLFFVFLGGCFQINQSAYPPTPMIEAVQSGNLIRVKELISVGADVNLVGIECFRLGTPLHFAAKYGHRIIIEVLLENGANIDARVAGENALVWAVRSGKIESLKLLLRKGSKSVSSDRIIYCAVQNNRLEILKLLLGKGILPNDSEPLFEAVRYKRTEMLKLLLNKNPKFKVRFLLNTAVEYKNIDAVKILERQGYKIDKYTNEEINQIKINEEQEKKVQLFYELIYFGGNGYARNKNGKTAFELLEEKKYDEAMLLAGQ